MEESKSATANSEILQSQVRFTSSYGRSLDASFAAGVDAESQQTWQQRQNIDTTRQIKLVRLSHVRYQHPDLEAISIFLRDFGMFIVEQKEDKMWFGGYGRDPYCYYAQRGPKKFLGATFIVEGDSDLEKASQLPGASAIEEQLDAPGGGKMVNLHDPEGFPINLIHGQKMKEVGSFPEKLLFNDETLKTRKGAFQRFSPGPAAVHKLGHYGLTVKIESFMKLIDWYCRVFNFMPTDFLYVNQETGTRKDVGAFFHIDRGSEFVDHHSFFVTSHKSHHVHHSSFEVHDFDTQQLGHYWLAGKGYTSVWGVGRHVLGSQIFDYWWDTSGFMLEHYSDGDLVNDSSPVSILPAVDESLAVWGPEVPKYFLE